eukprot:gene18373-20919_t
MTQFLDNLWDLVAEFTLGPPGIDMHRPIKIDLQAQQPIVVEEDAITIRNLEASGLKSITVPSIQIFNTLSYHVRQSDRELWASLSEANNNKAVYGPPGTGKSSIVLAYGMHAATQRGLSVLYMHTSANSHSIISKTSKIVTSPDVESVRADQWRLKRHGENVVDVVLFIDRLLNKTKYDLVIIDADEPELCQHVNGTAGIGRAIICNSQLTLKISGSTMVDMPTNLIFNPSWKEEEILAAIASGCIGPFTAEQHARRYYFGGSCIRLYLTDIHEVQKHIQHSVATLPTENVAKFVKGHGGYHLPLAAEPIIVGFNEGRQRGLVSQYATKLFVSKCTPELMQYRYLHPGFLARQGWAKKMEVMHLLSTGTLRLWDESNAEEIWTTAGARIPVIKRVVDDNDIALYDTYPPGMRLLPDGWNDGLFDCIQIVGDADKTVRVVHVTSSKKSSFRLAQLNAYLNALGTARVDFVFVCPHATFDDFVLPAVRDASLSVPMRTERGGLLRLGLDYYLTANATMEIEVRKLCYEEMREPNIGKRLREDRIEPNLKRSTPSTPR